MEKIENDRPELSIDAFDCCQILWGVSGTNLLRKFMKIYYVESH